MKRFVVVGLGIVSAGALAAAAYFVFAQSSATKTAPVEAEKPASPAKVAGRFGRWSMRCVGGGEDKNSQERCSLVLSLVEQKTQKQIFGVIVTYGRKGKLVMSLHAPTGVALQRGIELSPDTKKLYRIPYHTCLPKRCQALLTVEDALRQELAKSKQGSITIYAMNGKPVRAPMPLDGFSEGMTALVEKSRASTGGL